MGMTAGCDPVSKVHIVNLDHGEVLGIQRYKDMIAKEMKIFEVYEDADADDDGIF